MFLMSPQLLAVVVIAVISASGRELTVDSVTNRSEATARRWSDPASWPNRRVPAANEDVEIPAGMHIVLDISPPPLGKISVRGTLSVAEKDLSLETRGLSVQGLFRIGTPERPFSRRLLVTLTGTRVDSASADEKAIVVHAGGRLEWHATPRVSWLRLAGTARAGDTTLILDRRTNWRAGDSIVVAPTGRSQDEAEVAIVARIRGDMLTLRQPLRFTHWGERQTIAERTVDERAEVGVLTRQIVIQGDSTSERDGYGGHVLVHGGGSARIDGVAFVRLGQSGIVARYPMHWHMAGDVTGQYVRRSSVVRSYNRCLAIHGSHRAEIADNVCYDHAGHGYFIEDGVEHDNVLRGNLGLLSRRGTVLPTDQTPATFWFASAANIVEGNVAAGSIASGFWYDLAYHPTGVSASTTLHPFRTPLGRFADNVAHSSRDGLFVEGSGVLDTHGDKTTDFRPRVDPSNERSAAVIARFERFTAYGNHRALWTRGDHHIVTNSVIADNDIGVHFGDAAVEGQQTLRNTLVVGRSANSAAAPAGAHRGFLLYDGDITLDSVTFANFSGAGSAIGPEPGFGGIVSAATGGRSVRFVNSTPFQFPAAPRTSGETQAVFVDHDGAVTGIAGSSVVSSAPLMSTGTCVARSEWNAAVCPGRYAMVWVVSHRQPLPMSPATVTRDDGVAATVPGYSPASFNVTVPLGHGYRIAPAAGTPPHFHVTVRGLDSADVLDLEIPYTARTSDAEIGADGMGYPVAWPGSCAAVRLGSVTALALDGARRTLCLRLVGRAKGSEVTVTLGPR